MQDTTTPGLRPFDQADFDTFSGVETDEPKIAYTINAAIILDGAVLQVHDGVDRTLHLGLPTPKVAELVAEAWLLDQQGVDGRIDFERVLGEYGFQEI